MLSFSRNFGHQPAVQAGIDNCSGSAAIIIDADLQDPPEIAERMIDKYLSGEDGTIFFKNLISNLKSWK